tara:strand:- start:945 stop:1850 length:906 start_codon:yes stop_codon:yes gene_type:complete
MAQTCVTIPEFPAVVFPTLDDLILPFKDFYAIPSWVRLDFPPFPTLPSMPACPTISLQMPTMYMPSMEGVVYAVALQAGQVLVIIDIIIGQLVSFIPAIPFPEMPGFPNIDLIALLTFDPMALLAAIRLPDFDFSLIPDMPELWPTLDMPDLSSLKALQYAVSNYITLITNTMLELLDSFLSYLDSLELPFPALPVWPTIPSMQDIKDAISAALVLPEWPGFITFPGFPPIPIVLPIRLDGLSFDLEFEHMINAAYQSMRQYIVQLVFEFIGTLPLIVIPDLPTIADLVGAISIPEMCWEE